jgi:SAM-dependent methyltransferase
MKPPADNWKAADAYEQFMGRWSRQLAVRFLEWLSLPASGRWLEVGCGTGALTQAICLTADPACVVACDPSGSFVDFARRAIVHPAASFRVAGSDDLPRRPGGFDAVVSGLVLNLIPEPAEAVRQMRDRLRPGGSLAAYVWDYADGMQFLRVFWDVAVELDPGAGALDEGRRFPLCRREALAELFEHQGLRSIETRALEVTTAFADFAGYWNPFLGGTGPAPSYVASLGEDAREQLRRELSERLAPKDGDSIRLAARAWAVRGARAVPPAL